MFLDILKGIGVVKFLYVTNLPISKVLFIDHDMGWISGGYSNNDGFRPLFLRSVDGGENWTHIYEKNYLINDFYFENRHHGWAVGGIKRIEV